MNADFENVMSNKTDEELIQIVTISREDYQPLAVKAAEEEIENRKIELTRIEEVQHELVAKTDEQKQLDKRLVNPLLRFFHLIIDTIVCLLFSMILSFVLDVIIGKVDQTSMQIIGSLILLVSFGFYYIFMETKYQKTIGKYITKTKVVTQCGEKPNVGYIISRTVFRLIPFDLISYLFVSNGIHDILSNTKVIKDNDKNNRS